MHYPPNQSYGNQGPNDQTTSSWQPTMSNQQYPPMPPQSPSKPPSWWRRQKRITKIGILGCGLPTVIVLLCVCSLTALGLVLPKQPASSVASNSVQATATPTHAAIHVATPPKSTPTPKPAVKTQTPTSAPASSGAAVLGATLDAFKAKYGPPNSHSDPNQGQYYFSVYGTGQSDLTVQFLGTTHAEGLILDAPGNNTYWSESEATSHCLALLPSDADYQRQLTVRGGDPTTPDIQRVYSVPSLASLFSSSDWTDENGNQTTAGTVGMVLGHWTTTSGAGYIDCTVQIGLQSV